MQYSPEDQRQFAEQIVRTLREAGFEAVWAGGCVRDMLLGQTPKDYDVATNATPVEVRKLFGFHRTLAVGASFGVIVVVGGRKAGQVDVATFRSDGTYSDGRRPDSVTFGTAEEDVKRRDFTINGLLYDPLEDRVIDYVGRQADLANGVIRAIGDPFTRFSEDKLRLLRAVRFAARFDFTLEAQTRAAIEAMADRVVTVAPERIAQELRPMLIHPNRRRAVELLGETGLAQALVPELKPVIEDGTAWKQTLDRLERLKQPPFVVALAAWLLELGPETTANVAQRWRLSNKECEEAVWLLKHLDRLREAPTLPWSQVQPMLVNAWATDLCDLAEADAETRGQATDHVAWCREKLALPPHELDPPPLISGNDLRALGIPPGKLYSTFLRRVREAQLDGQLTTPEQALAAVAQWWKEQS